MTETISAAQLERDHKNGNHPRGLMIIDCPTCVRRAKRDRRAAAAAARRPVTIVTHIHQAVVASRASELA